MRRPWPNVGCCAINKQWRSSPITLPWSTNFFRIVLPYLPNFTSSHRKKKTTRIFTSVSPSILTRFTYLLTPWCRVLKKLNGLELVKKFPAFHGTRRFITALKIFYHLSLSWASPIQSIYPHPTSWRSILTLSTHLRLGLSSGLFPSCFPTKTLYTPLIKPIRATCPAHLTLDL